MYAPEEYATDSSARMRVTAYIGATLVGTSTTTASPPGTWPTGTLSFSSAQGFDRVVVQYDAPPPTGGDYGPIFMGDNMIVTAAPASIPEPGTYAMLLAGLCLLGFAAHRRLLPHRSVC